jgi:hypothetical protein
MKRTALITLILGTALAIAPAAHAVVMSDGSGGDGTAVTSVVTDGWMSSITAPVTSVPTIGPNKAEYRALMARGEALNQLYGNALTRLSPQEFTALYQAGGDRLSTQELVALVERGDALNSEYGSGSSVTFRPDILGGDGGVSTPAVPAATGDDSFAWNAAIGGAALIGAMLLALGFAVANRRRHQLSF